MELRNLEIKFQCIIFKMCIQSEASSRIKPILLLYHYIKLYEVYETLSVFSAVTHLRSETV